MKKHDISTTIGLIAGTGLTFWGMAAGGTNLIIFFDPASIAITVGGSFAALLIAYPVSAMKKVMTLIIQSFKESTSSNTEIIDSFTNLSKKARREGLLSLEDEMSTLTNEFLKKGLQMVVDGLEPETIKDIMELEIGEMERRHTDGANMLKAWAAYAPAFGMIGTLVGLIQMLANLSDSSALASGMGKALITTFYGALLANIILVPMAQNLNYKSSIEVNNREMMLEGILAIQSGVNPRIVEEKLMSYLAPNERIKFVADHAKEAEVTENV
ncbi:motility protein A [Clostridium lacusfryxellense]|uniref:motility protein A n=1 Tax=Clostridium lacusfryxellense TaxID=205328 RepID=UPI001C0C7CFE|nr:motility protein A [Clostridium lacusfryxellense]MBU3111790.1 motility protein A [Clostridium lacusfryxellense]